MGIYKNKISLLKNCVYCRMRNSTINIIIKCVVTAIISSYLYIIYI